MKDSKFVFVFVVLVAFTFPELVYAAFSGGRKSAAASSRAYTKCRGNGSGHFTCSFIRALADPPANGVVDISISIKYDPTLWIFRENESGFLCDFSSNGDCPPAMASTGLFQIEQLSFNAGDPLPGSTVSLTNDSINGLVSLSYHLQDPIVSDVDQNFFSFHFDHVREFELAGTTIEYFDTPGVYDFMQTSFNCTTSLGGECGSQTPITGFNVKIKPLLATIDDFSVIRNSKNKVEIKLVTGSEVKTSTLQVYRAPEVLQDLQQIQEVCKWDSVGTKVLGSVYSCEDENAPAGVVYWPADLEYSGAKNQYLEFITNVQ